MELSESRSVFYTLQLRECSIIGVADCQGEFLEIDGHLGDEISYGRELSSAAGTYLCEHSSGKSAGPLWLPFLLRWW